MLNAFTQAMDNASAGIGSRSAEVRQPVGSGFKANGQVRLYGGLTTEVFRPIHSGVHPESKSIEVNEAGGVVLIVGLGRVSFHGC